MGNWNGVAFGGVPGVVAEPRPDSRVGAGDVSGGTAVVAASCGGVGVTDGTGPVTNGGAPVGCCWVQPIPTARAMIRVPKTRRSAPDFMLLPR